MKMTTLLWRVVSVGLCLAVVCWLLCCYAACTESHQESQKLLSSQDISLEEELEGKDNYHKESSVLPTESLSESQVLMEGEQQEDQTNQESDKKEQYSEPLEQEEPTVDIAFEAHKGLLQSEAEPEHSSESLYLEASATEDQDSGPLLPSPDPSFDFAADFKDNPGIDNLQDIISNSVSDDASDVAAPEVFHSDLPPSDCEEEQNNLYDSDSSPPMVLENTSNAHTTGTKIHTDASTSSQAIHSTQHLEANTSNVLNEQDLSSSVTTDTDSSVSSKDPEDIPTFDEWKRKMMEVEKEKTQSTHTSNNEGSHTVKKVQKNFNNYASVECGAKILGSNPEAKSTSAILKENMDLYMLNPCSNKIWFIIELCEPIQVKQLDIANFELFSSTPKDFLVSISDRYPTNKWLKLGTFHARDERTVQSFPLDEHLYAKYVKMFTKYIKVELVSHFGSEHFCPLSLIRVFGTSMVEEYEEIADPTERPDDQDDDLDYPPGYASGEVKLSKNLIGSAKDVILNMVSNIAVNVLGGGSEVQGNVSSQELNITVPSTQLETTTDPTSIPDTEEVDISPGSEMPVSEASSAEIPVPEMGDSDATKQELPPLEQIIVTPLEKEEAEPVSSTITLLEREDEVDYEKVLPDRHEQKQENLNYCSAPSSASSCSCAASLQEYLHRQSSALLSKKTKCQKSDTKPVMPPIQTPTWQQPVFPAAFPEPQLHPGEVHQLHEKEQASQEEPEKGASPSETPQPSESTTASHRESMSEPPVLEPSQTSNLPKSTATNSSPAKPTPIVQTPPLSSEEPANEPSSEKSPDVQTVEKHIEPSASLSSSLYVKPIVSTTVDESLEPSTAEYVESQIEISTTVQILDKTDQLQVLFPETTPHLEHHSDSTNVPESTTASTKLPHPSQDIVTELEPSGAPPVMTETKMEDLTDDISTSSGSNGHLPRASSPVPPASPSLSDIYAETPNATEQNGNPVHGSNQKESVFMRLNNRIKALEMNMSLSGRYLEQLSQRYRKQMEEMQKAFNKTILKLQNTSKVAEEQDQRQTESIQLLQGQLENMTQLVLNLSVRVSQLQSEVSDRHNYLLLSLALCLGLGLLVFASHCRISTVPPATEPNPPIQKNYTRCSSERQISSCDETSLKRSASYPLIHSESLQLATTEGAEMLHAVERQMLGPLNRKKRRRKTKSIEKVETLKPSFHASELCNGAVICNSAPITTIPPPLTKRLLQPTFRDSPSEGSSEASSHSDDPSFCGITTACSRMCDGLPPPKTRAEKRASRRRCSKPRCAVVDLLQAPRLNNGEPSSFSTIQEIMNRKTEQSSGTFKVNVTLSGPG